MSGQAGITGRASNLRAISLGTLSVNFPTALIWFGGWFAPALLLPQPPKVPIDGVPETWRPLVIVCWLAVPPAAAWLWWAFSVPKWRLWALEHSNDWGAVEQSAIRNNIISDESTILGRLFSSTEIWSARQRAHEAELRRARGLPPRGSVCNP